MLAHLVHGRMPINDYWVIIACGTVCCAQRDSMKAEREEVECRQMRLVLASCDGRYI